MDYRCFLLFLTLTPILSPTECVTISQRSAFRDAYVVFRGKVTGIDDLNRVDLTDPQTGKLQLQPADPSDAKVVTFSVDRGWKGPVTRLMKVLAFGKPSFGRGYSFRYGTEYVAYAVDEVDQEWDTVARLRKGAVVYDIGQCWLRIRTDVAAESRRLGAGWAPKK